MLDVWRCVQGSKLMWFGHNERRNSDYVSERMLRLEPRGCPKKGFTDLNKEDMRVIGMCG